MGGGVYAERGVIILFLSHSLICGFCRMRGHGCIRVGMSDASG
jgi:hypothetical protein